MLKEFYGEIREQRGLESMAAGLWLSADVLAELQNSDSLLQEFKSILDEEKLVWTTANAFPYGKFHGETIKAAVYQPNWSEPARLDYTCNVARLMAALLPSSLTSATISTLPLGYAADWCADKHLTAIDNIIQLVKQLTAIKIETGKSIRVCLEMEPDCVLEFTPQIIEFFELLHQHAKAENISSTAIESHLGICYDICHQAVQFESIPDSLAQIHDAGIAIGKIQISTALEITVKDKVACMPWLTECARSPYLHQTRIRSDQGLIMLPDLDDVFETTEIDDFPWRIHFHLPIHVNKFHASFISSTQQQIIETLTSLKSLQITPTLEIETYTWNVMPAEIRPTSNSELIRSLQSELDWLENALTELALIKA